MSNGNQARAPKKGLSNWVWVGIGCAVVLLMVAVASSIFIWWGVNKAKQVAADFEGNPAKAAAKMIVMANPELEEVTSDDDEGTITIRNTRTGEVFTVNYEDIEEGKLSFTADGKEVVTIDASGGEDGTVVKVTGEDGELSFSAGERTKGERPEWAPVYPECEPTSEHVMQRPEGVTGGFELTTPDAIDTVVDFYRTALEDLGFEVSVNTFSGPQGDSAMISSSDEAGGRTVIIAINRDEEATSIGLTYNVGG